MAKQTVTMGAATTLYDASVYIAGKGLFLVTNDTPAKLVQFPNLDDLSTQNIITFPNDSKHLGAAQPNLTYDSSGGYLYASFWYEDGSFDEHCLIVKIDPNDITTRTDPFADFIIGTNSLPAIAMSITTDGTSLWILSKPALENSWIARVNIAAPTTRDGTNPIAPVQFTGSNHIRGHALKYDSITDMVYFAGTKFSGGKLAWTGRASKDLGTISIIDVSTTKGFSDDLTFIGSNYFLNYENEDSRTASVCKVAKDLSATTDYSTGGGAFDLDGQYYDGTYLWVSVSSSPCVLKAMDPATGTVVSSVPLDSGETLVNEINPYTASDHLILTTSTTPSKAIRQPLSSVPTPLPPVARRTLYF